MNSGSTGEVNPRTAPLIATAGKSAACPRIETSKFEVRTCTSKFTCTSTTFNDHCRLTTNACNFNILKKKSHQAKTSLWTLSGRIEHTRIWVRNRSIIGPKAVSMCIAYSSWTLQCKDQIQDTDSEVCVPLLSGTQIPDPEQMPSPLQLAGTGRLLF